MGNRRTAQDIARKVSTSAINLCNPDLNCPGMIFQPKIDSTGEKGQYPTYTKARPPSNSYKRTLRGMRTTHV